MTDRNSRARGLGRRTVVKGIAAGAALAATGLYRGPARAQSQTLKVGVLFPLSGYLAQDGRACQLGADVAPIALKDMGHSVSIMSADWQSNVDLARTQAEKMIDEGAHVLVGAFDSGGTTAIAQVCAQRGVPFVINIGAAPQITESGYKTVFRNFPSAPMLVRNGLSEIKEFFKATGQSPKTAVLMRVNDTFGQAMHGGISHLFPTLDMGFTIVEDIAYDPKAQDLSVEVAKAQATKADFVMVVTHGSDAIKLVREMVKQRYSPQGIVTPGSPGMYDPEFYSSLGKYSDYPAMMVPWANPKSALTQHVEKAFKAKFPKDRWDTDCFNVGFTFEAILVAADAAKRAGSTDKTALVEALRKTNIAERVMIGGPITFDEKGQTLSIITPCVQNRNNGPKVVLPKEAAQLAPVFPMPAWQNRT